VPGFDIASFWSALAGAFIVSIVGWLLNAVLRDEPRDWKRRG
jgi:uncharacterized membrane protein YvlD (DUF360 family)